MSQTGRPPVCGRQGGTRNRHSAPDRVLCTHEQNTTLF